MHFWISYSRVYDRLILLKPYYHMLEDIIKAMDLKPGLSILDAGCGTGNLELMLATHPIGMQCKITAIDQSKEMLAIAKEKLEAQEQTSWSHGDLNKDFALLNGPFNRIILSNVVYALDYPVPVIQHLLEKLDRQGMMLIVNPKKKNNIFSIFKNHMDDSKPNLIQAFRLFLYLIKILYYNLIILLMAGKRKFNFWDKKDWDSFFKKNNLTASYHTTYAGQAYLIVVKKNSD